MKFLITIATLLIVYSLNAQISQGSNFISISNTVLNSSFTRFDDYPDTTLSDSVTTTGANASIMLNYHFAVSNHFTAGFKSRFLTNKESTYGISAFGPTVRYYFGFGPDEPRKKIYKVTDDKRSKLQRNGPPVHTVHRFYNYKTKERLKGIFFIEGSYLFGNMRFDGNRVSYAEAGLIAGAMLRFATPETQLIRHFGIELGVGAFSMTDEFSNSRILPNVSAGLLIFLDKKYTSHRKIMRVVEYEEIEK